MAIALHILTRYSRRGASSRLRSLQYCPSLVRAGFKVEVQPLFDDAYLTDLYSDRRKPLKTLGYYTKRLMQCRAARQAEIIWIEKEALPWVPWAFEQAILPKGVPYVVDYDDAVFHRYDQHKSAIIRRILGRKINNVMAGAACVMVGNAYLEEHARVSGAKRIERVPTVVDLERYFVKPRPEEAVNLVVGWIGTPKTWANSAEPTFLALRSTLEATDAVFRAIGASLIARTGDRLKIKPWSETEEVAEIQKFDIGIMPLDDDPWTRGKCGYKLIQYMACGIPVVASPIGMNTEIVQHGVNGFLAETPEEWHNAVLTLLKQPDLRQRMGEAGRRWFEDRYSLQIWAPRVAGLLKSVALKK